MYSNIIRQLTEFKNKISKKRFLFNENIDKFGFDEMKQLIKVKNTSEVKGYPFLLTKKSGIQCAIKIVPVELKYEKNEHPSYLEFILLKFLTENLVDKSITPHITYYLGQHKLNNRSKAIKFLNLKKLEVEEKIRSSSNMLIAEYVSGGSLDNWIYNCYENDIEITKEQWCGFTFQLLYTIHILQDKYKIMHNDFHYGNILVDNSLTPTPGSYFVYNLHGKKYYIQNNGFIPKLWDFEFAMSYSDSIPHSYPNKFVLGDLSYDKSKHIAIESSDDLDSENEPKNVPVQFNKFYDPHYFLTSLLDLYISQELFDWIMSIYPSDLIPDDPSKSSRSSRYTRSSLSSESKSSGKSIAKSESTEYSRNSNSPTSSTLSSHSTHSYSRSYSSQSSTDSSNSSNSHGFLWEGRLINGIEKKYPTLPDALYLLNLPFFDTLTTVPLDFDEEQSFFFNYN